MQNADLNNDQQMFDIIEALDDAHSDLNGLTLNCLHATIDQLESNPIIKDSTYVGDARHEVNCYVCIIQSVGGGKNRTGQLDSLTSNCVTIKSDCIGFLLD